MILQDIIMRLAEQMMPVDQRDWGRAMRAEYRELSDKGEKLTFALGCLQVSLIRAAQTRQGLSVIGRGLVFIALLSFSLAGLIMAKQFQTVQAANLITGLCFFYAGAAGLTALNLRGLQVYSGLGLIGAIIAWAAIKLTRFQTAALPDEFLHALSFEAVFITGGIFIAALYLSLINSQEQAVL